MSFGWSENSSDQKVAKADRSPRKKAPETLADCHNGDIVRLEFAGVIVKVCDTGKMTDKARNRTKAKGLSVWCRAIPESEMVYHPLSRRIGERYPLPSTWRVEPIELAP